MTKTISRILCVVLCLLLLLPLLAACGKKYVYELGPYSIRKDEYAYLLSTYKRDVLEGLGLDESYLNYPYDSSHTYGEYIETAYREEFEQSVYTLLYSLALFDEYDLSLTDEEKKSVKTSASTIIMYYGNNSVSKFNSVAKEFGFSDDTIFDIYEKQAKETKLINYLFGKDFSKLTESQKEKNYQDNYIHFQIIVVNTLYQKNSDGTFSNLTEEEVKAKKQLENELIELLCRDNYEYNYKVLPALLGKSDMSTVTYEEIWACKAINDDMLYPMGYYMKKPTASQMMNVTTLSQAMLTEIGDISAIAAKRFFEGSGTITTENGKETIKEGDYFEYGTAFIKRLEIDEGAWKKEENKDFFEDSQFLSGVAERVMFETYQSFEESMPYTLVTNTEYRDEYSFINVPANYLDYDYLHGKED